MMAVQSLATKVRLNQDTAKRLQEEHPEQFVTLVRMHLSFVLDLNTDTENDPVEQDKQKIKKWKGFHKKAKGCTSVKATTSPETAKTTLTAPIISNLRQLIAFLEQEHNISQEGIFRKTGSLARQGELKNLLVQGNTLPLDQGDYTAHDCASVLKNFLSELSEPLLTELYYPAYRQVAESFSTKDKEPGRGEDWLLNALQLLLLLLPEENHSLLDCLIDLLYRTVQHEATNKMSAENLAKLFTPHLICPRKLSANALHETASQMFVIVEFMIKTGPRLFHIPTKLATDIRAYFVEQNRRRTMSPEHILNESTTSDSVANTVYTFVDRQKTAEAHIIDSTDTALAELYAHIQSLPESSKKKKLVSKFNHQNRYGTPVQRSSGGSGGGGGGGSVGPKYPRSFGDSIKRHIFHKSLMSRTPKRSATTGGTQTPTLFQTPNGSSYHAAKQRVLFQSPASAISSPSSSNSPAQLLRRTSSTLSSSSSTGTPSISTPSSKQQSLRVSSVASASRSASNGTGTESSEPRKDLKRQSSEGLGTMAIMTSPTADETEQERKRSRVEEPTGCDRPRSTVVRFATTNDTDECVHEVVLPAPEDDEDFVDQEDDDIGSDRDDGEDREADSLDDPAEDHAFVDEDDFSSDELLPDRMHSDTEDERYGSSLGESRSRYRSEPNLSAIVWNRGHFGKQTAVGLSSVLAEQERDTPDGGVLARDSRSGQIASSPVAITPGSSTKQRRNINFFKNKLIKGVSMGNLRFPFGSDSKSSKKSGESKGERPRSSSTSVGSSASGLFNDRGWMSTLNKVELGENLPQQQQGSIMQAGTGWPGSYLTSTPGPGVALANGRNSMSPITKSTQRMPKSMQESIMTPRSRKPVMMLAALHGNDHQHQQHQLSSTTCASFSSLREEDEESDPEPMIEPASLLLPAGPRPPTGLDQNIIKLINDTGLPPIADEVGLPPLPIVANQQSAHGATLTSSFRDYLLSRSVMPESPTDLSFASQSDDFESSNEILERSESKMSESLLHVLDGNVPPVETEGEGHGTVQPASVVNTKPIGELDETDL
ncbi:rho gtpase activating protein [Anopheles darlingi]|uniref:Rho gtpase activating protein n=1 Tax=Anopheles darlingi TaxID=43151 RepID=W5J5I4_ANODA|nr:rho gtpase activating protein [Anopheles darlingi]